MTGWRNGSDNLPVDGEEADQLAFLDHRHHEKGPNTTELNGGHGLGIAFGVGLLGREVGDMHQLFGRLRSANDPIRTQRCAPACLDQRGRRVVGGSELEHLAITQVQIPEVGFADTGGTRQHGLEHRLQLPR